MKKNADFYKLDPKAPSLTALMCMTVKALTSPRAACRLCAVLVFSEGAALVNIK